MSWYNRWIFRHIGNRRLLTEEEFRLAMLGRFQSGQLRVVEARDHELLLDIAATSQGIVSKYVGTSRGPIRFDDALVQRLQSALISYKIREQDQQGGREEVSLMEIPG